MFDYVFCNRSRHATVSDVPLILSFMKELIAKAMDEWTVYQVTNEALDELAKSRSKNE